MPKHTKKSGGSHKSKRAKEQPMPHWWYGPALLGLVLVFSVLFHLTFSNPPTEQRDQNQSTVGETHPPIVEEEERVARHPLTGVWESEARTSPVRLFGVMIDNNASAWPHEGLTEALMVVEAPVEGNITRILAIFSDEQEVDSIGPVRSARPYFLDWNAELDAMYVHVGGSPQALEDIADGAVIDLNEYWNGDHFERAEDRFAPHNVLTSIQDLTQALDEYEERQEVRRLYGGLNFKDDNPVSEPVDGPSIEFWAPTYVVDWTYEPQTNSYMRSQGGEPHITVDRKAVRAKNVIVIETDISVIDSVGRREIRTLGSGNALIYQDGGVIEGEWRKPSVSQRLRFYNTEGEELPLNAGTTWIEVVSTFDWMTNPPE